MVGNVDQDFVEGGFPDEDGSEPDVVGTAEKLMDTGPPEVAADKDHALDQLGPESPQDWPRWLSCRRPLLGSSRRACGAVSPAP